MSPILKLRISKNHPRRIVIIVTLCNFFITYQAYALEIFRTSPSARAMGMAGVFSGQVNESSAIWYNPAGLKRADGLQKDFAISMTQRPIDDPAEANHLTREFNLNHLSAYIDHLTLWNHRYQTIGVGLAYFSLYKIPIEIDEPQDITNPLIGNFGFIDATYHQFSVSLASPISAELTLGATLDMLWSDITCRSYDFCVDNGPFGLGFSIGAMYHFDIGKARLTVGAVWRPQASLNYLSSPKSGIGSILDEYIHDRPASRHLAMNIQFSVAKSIINTNFLLEKILWNDAAGIDTDLPDYYGAGIGTEFVFPLNYHDSIALRFGVKNSRSSNTTKAPHMNIHAVGIGYGHGDHFIDVAYESRKILSNIDQSIQLLSLSYALQY